MKKIQKAKPNLVAALEERLTTLESEIDRLTAEASSKGDSSEQAQNWDMAKEIQEEARSIREQIRRAREQEQVLLPVWLAGLQFHSTQ